MVITIFKIFWHCLLWYFSENQINPDIVCKYVAWNYVDYGTLEERREIYPTPIFGACLTGLKIIFLFVKIYFKII